MMKLNIRRFYPDNKGFTLIELILAIGICSVIILPSFSILHLSLKSYRSCEDKDEVLLNARYGIEYIKNEIKNADLIISSDKIKDLNSNYPTNIGFLILIIEEVKKDHYTYTYITYYIKNGKIIRIAHEATENKNPTASSLKGFNEICSFAVSIGNTKFDWKNRMINLDFTFKSCPESQSILNVKSDIFIRCDIDY